MNMNHSDSNFTDGEHDSCGPSSGWDLLELVGPSDSTRNGRMVVGTAWNEYTIKNVLDVW